MTETVSRLPEKGIGLALEILEQVARDNRGASAADIARAVGAPRATVYRVVNSLVRDEYLVRRADFSGFLLGARVLELAALVGAVRPAHAPIVERLRAETGEAVHLFALHGGGFTVLDEDPASPLCDRAAMTADPTASAVGHLWLITFGDADGSDRRWGDASHDMRQAIAEAYAVRGYTEQVALLAPDRGCLAVPVTDDARRVVGAVTLSTSIAQLSLAARHVSALRDAAASLALPVAASR